MLTHLNDVFGMEIIATVYFFIGLAATSTLFKYTTFPFTFTVTYNNSIAVKKLVGQKNPYPASAAQR